jgi:hypothetical protein
MSLLAQYNVGRLRYRLDDPRMADFVNNVDRINKLAERIEGFVWRLSGPSGNALDMGPTWDIVPNITLWRDTESLKRFAYQTAHKHFIARKDEWFLPLSPKLVMWWVDDDHRPTMVEGADRLLRLAQYGPHQDAFGF